MTANSTSPRLQVVPYAAVLVSLLTLLLATRAPAQEIQPQAQPSTSAMTDQDLAKSVHNPFEDFVKVPIQSTTGFQVGHHHSVGDGINIEPVFPFSLSENWDLIARPSVTLAYLPGPHEQSGLADMQASFFLTPAKNTNWIWGVGPILQFPTASSSGLGSGQWAAGPSVAGVYSKGPWFDAVLMYQLMSFAGNRERGSVNQTYVEPQGSYNLDSGWYIQCDPAITFDWTAKAANAWTVPIGADIGKALNVGSHALSFQVGAYDLVKRPDGAPQWIARVSMTFLFPTEIK